MPTTTIEPLLQDALATLRRAGVEYAAARGERRRQESLIVQNGAVHHVAAAVSEGCALRARVQGAWGYAASSRLTGPGLKTSAAHAVAMAKACARLHAEPVPFPAQPPQRGSYRTPLEVDPFTVPLQKKLDY